MAERATVIGVGNEFRRDDGVGPAVIARLADYHIADVSLVITDGEPTKLLDAWSDVPLAVIVDAAVCTPSAPGRIHRTALGEALPAEEAASTHGLGLPEAIRLGEALNLLPERMVVLTVEAADTGMGQGLSPEVAEAVPRLAEAVLAELRAGVD